MQIRGAARTDRGKVRQKNEDAFGFFPDAAFYVVADGMGGHAGGKVASALAVEAMRLSVQETEEEELTPVTDPHGWRSVGWRRLQIATQQANSKVFETSQREPNLKGMGTTIAALLFDDEELDQNRKTRDAVLPAQPSESAKRKKGTKLAADGLAIHSFDTLLADLATKTRNTCRLKASSNKEPFILYPTPTPLQKKALDLLGL